MVQFRPKTRELISKVVYYGPPLGGKTTNLRSIYAGYPQDTRGELVIVPTGSDRTIFFDFLPVDLGTLRGMRVRVQLYTVPGQVRYNATRQVVLRGVDGVVFVADSQNAVLANNRESWENLKDNLLLQGLKLAEVPHVVQYNKRDLKDIATVETLDELINEYNAPFYEAVAPEGIGVEETLQGVVKLVVRSLRERFQLEGEQALTQPIHMGIPGGRRGDEGVPGERDEGVPDSEGAAGAVLAAEEAPATEPREVTLVSFEPSERPAHDPSAAPTATEASLQGGEPGPGDEAAPAQDQAAHEDAGATEVSLAPAEQEPEQPEVEPPFAGEPADEIGAPAPVEPDRPLQEIPEREGVPLVAVDRPGDAGSFEPPGPEEVPATAWSDEPRPDAATNGPVDGSQRVEDRGFIFASVEDRKMIGEPPVFGPETEAGGPPPVTFGPDGEPESLAGAAPVEPFEVGSVEPGPGEAEGVGRDELIEPVFEAEAATVTETTGGLRAPGDKAEFEPAAQPFGAPGLQGEPATDVAGVAAGTAHLDSLLAAPAGTPAPEAGPATGAAPGAGDISAAGVVPVPEGERPSAETALAPGLEEPFAEAAGLEDPFAAAAPPPESGADDVFAITPAPPRGVTREGETVVVPVEISAVRRAASKALAQYGEVRELELEVPVPAPWTGGRRMTLQLRLTLVPQEEPDER